MHRITGAAVGGLAALGLVGVGFGLGSSVASATPQDQVPRASMEAMFSDCQRHMDELSPVMEEMMESQDMQSMMGSDGMTGMMGS